MQKVSNNFQCGDCDAKFIDEGILANHYAWAHTDNEQHEVALTLKEAFEEAIIDEHDNLVEMQAALDAQKTRAEIIAARHPKSQEFHKLLTEMGELHDKKQADYGRADDPFANVRASADFGMPAWVGAIMRANDKMRRLQTAAQGNVLKNESVEDSMLDMAVYALIGLILYREEE